MAVKWESNPESSSKFGSDAAMTPAECTPQTPHGRSSMSSTNAPFSTPKRLNLEFKSLDLNMKRHLSREASRNQIRSLLCGDLEGSNANHKATAKLRSSAEVIGWSGKW